jgi:hypothetical protein
MKPNYLIIATVFLAFAVFLPSQTHAFTFDKNLLITDQELEDYDLLTTAQIQAFLEEKGSVLAGYSTQDTDSVTKSVAEIIHNVSNKYRLSPMLFLVMAQKESSAITTSSLTYSIENWILGFGRCDSCSEEDAAPYRGVANQFNSAGERIREGYLADLEDHGYTISGWGPGRSKTTIDGIEVTPENDATAALYTYNPCVGAYGGGYSQYGCNSAFQKIWQEWNPGVKYPNGSLLQIGQIVYLIQDGKKRAFTSKGALLANYNTKNIIQVTSIVGGFYPDGANINFPNYTLLRSPSGTVYLLVNGKKRGFTSQSVMYSMGYNPEQILDTTWKEINAIPEGKPFTEKTQYPQGALLQDRSTGAISYIDPRGKRHPVWSKDIMDERFPGQPVIAASTAEIAQYTEVSPLTFPDGTLITSKKGVVYVIANGKRRAFTSSESFAKYGYQWDNIITVSQSIVKLHHRGKNMPNP